MDKTALAVHWAHRVAGRFPDGQLYINLRGFHPAGPAMAPAEAVRCFLDALGVPAPRIPADLDAQTGLYRSLLAGKRMLVVLDNAADADQVRPLIPGTPGSLAVITGRARLPGLTVSHGAAHLALDPLSTDESLELLRTLIGASRLAAVPDAAADLAARCGNLPLALRIAGAQLNRDPHRTLTDYLSTLDRDPLGSLAVAGDDSASIRVVFDQSYARLDPAERRMFRLLGLFPGRHIGLEAAAALAGAGPHDAGSLLDRLADAALVETLPGRRFGLHDLLRAYAASKVREDERAGADGLFDWYVRRARGAAGDLDDPARALSWLDCELANFVAIAQYTAAHGPHRVAWQLADHLSGYLWRNGRSPEWLMIARAGLRAAEAAADTHARALSHRTLASAHIGLARWDEAIAHYTCALRLARESGGRELERAASVGLAQAHRELGRLDVAARLLREALAEARDSHAPAAEVAGVLSRLGLVHTEAGDPAASVVCLREALEIYADAGELAIQQSKVHNNLALALRLRGDCDTALRHVTEAHGIARRRGDRIGQANQLDTYAGIYRDLGRLSRATDCALESIALSEELGDRRIQAHARNTLGEIYQRLGDRSMALEQHRAALDLAVATGTAYARVASLVGLAAAAGDPGEGLAAADQARALARRCGFRAYEGRSLVAAARIHLGAQRFHRARELAAEAAAIHRAGGHLTDLAAAEAVANT